MENRPPQTVQGRRSGCTRIVLIPKNRRIRARIAVRSKEPGDAQYHAAQGRKAAPDGGPIGTKSGGSITPKSGGPIPAKSGGSNHSKSCTEALDWLEADIADGRKHLLGAALSAADIAVCALLAPLACPDQHPVYSREDYRTLMRTQLAPWSPRPGLAWVRETYRQKRTFGAARSG